MAHDAHRSDPLAAAEAIIETIGPPILAFAWECYGVRGRGAVVLELDRQSITMSYCSKRFLDQHADDPQTAARDLLDPVCTYAPDAEAVGVVEWPRERAIIHFQTDITLPWAYEVKHGTKLLDRILDVSSLNIVHTLHLGDKWVHLGRHDVCNDINIERGAWDTMCDAGN